MHEETGLFWQREGAQPSVGLPGCTAPPHARTDASGKFTDTFSKRTPLISAGPSGWQRPHHVNGAETGVRSCQGGRFVGQDAASQGRQRLG